MRAAEDHATQMTTSTEQRETLRTLLAKMREDWNATGRDPSRPGLHAVLVYRFGFWQRGLPKALRLLLFPIYILMYWFVRNMYGIELPATARIGRRFWIAHQSGIVIHLFAEIGDDCLIRQNVTLGAAGEDWRRGPKLGDRVEVGAGAVIIGGVNIGDDVRVGPNAVVMTNVPAGARVVATPSRIIPPPRAVPEPVREEHVNA
jgi:serine O-acetyltransferase